MGFREDNVKLIDKDLEKPPTFTGEDEDLEEDYLDSSLSCRLVFVALVYVVVFGIGLSTLAFRDVGEENKTLNRGFRNYYQLKFYQHRKDLSEKEVYAGQTRDKPQYRFRPMFPDPPQRSEKAKTARFIVHNSNWGSISTISVSLNGAPFSMVTSFSDGTVDNSTGVPYFYLTVVDPVVKNIKVNQWASLSLSEAQSDYCKAHNWDTEEPLCSRVTLTGRLVHVGPDELKYAQNALFSRHPVMKTWPKDHDWQTLKLDITNVWLQDYYGPADIVSVQDYFKAKV